MNEITNKGNLPAPLKLMAKEVQGERSTMFFECRDADELLQHAADGKCEETTVTVDRKNDRGYMVAFSFNESQLEDLSGEKLVKMNVFFTELVGKDIQKYTKMLHEHRQQQEDSHSRWKNKQGTNNDQ